MVLFGLTGVSDDKRGAKRGGRLHEPYSLEALREPGPVAPTAHSAEQPPYSVLERQVEVSAAGADHGVDQTVGELGRIQIQEPDPRHRVNATSSTRARRLRLAMFATIGREVLCDEDDLFPLPSVSTSARMLAIKRERCLPRKDGIAQNPHLRSQPSATFTYAQGALRGRPGEVE